MAEITKLRLGQMVRKTLEILAKFPDGLAARDVISRVEKELGPTPFERSTYPNSPGIRRFDKILRFSTIGAVKAGWLIKSKGQWIITDAGRKAYSDFQDPTKLMDEVHRLYKKWKSEQPDDEPEEGPEIDTPGPATTIEEAEESAWSEIEGHLSRMNPYEFQNLVAALLRGMRYYVSWVAPEGPDRGVDIVAHKDPLGAEHGRIKVQVKRRGDKIPVGEVRSFMAMLGDADTGIFVATSGFTREAEGEARNQEKRRLMLLDSRRLLELWIEYYAAIPEEHKGLLPLRPVYFLAPAE